MHHAAAPPPPASLNKASGSSPGNTLQASDNDEQMKTGQIAQMRDRSEG
jgi:hypothetical protein